MSKSRKQGVPSDIAGSGHGPERTLRTLQSVSYRAGELQQYMDSVCQVMLDLLGDGLSAITLYRDGVKNVLARCPADDSAPRTMDVHGNLSTYVVNNKAILKVADAQVETRYGAPPAGYCSYLGVPLCLPNGDVVGTICYFDREKRNFSDNDQRTAELFAERVAIALDNYEMFQQLERHSDSLETLVQQRTEQLLAARDELAQKEQLAAVGEFAAQITHEVRNPLTTIRLTLEYLQNNPERDASKRVELAVGEVSRLERMLNQVLLYARPAEPQTEPIELAAFCADFIATYASVAAQRQQNLILQLKARPTISADRDKLTQILLNLVHNACEAEDIGGEVHLRCSADEGSGIVSIHNGGESIPASKMARITEPFVSGKPSGSGLGLAIVVSLLRAQGGRLDLVSEVDAGTTATIYLPELAS